VPQLPFAQVPPIIGHADAAAVHRSPTQHPPDAHSLSAQHGWPAAPHCAQTPPAQTLLVAHWPPAQHGWPAPPHCWQTSRTHAPWVHVPLQHAAPIAPQVPGPVVVWPLPPQATATEMTAKRNHVQAAMRIGRYLPSMRTTPH
jgi:hypothetical protein